MVGTIVTYEVKLVNGKEVSRKKIQTVVIKQPVKQVVVRGVTVAGDVWAALRQCECGGDYGCNTGNGFYGAYQFDYSTWQSNAPSSYRDMYPHQAPPNIQDAAAQNLQSRRGWYPWPACARKLGLI
ncbi:resuscitation-promoting factor [Candidatus Microgenomates bacterium]|nr:resuscitation-promoting factor [Candidatus Microgenomates bacterium]